MSPHHMSTNAQNSLFVMANSARFRSRWNLSQSSGVFSGFSLGCFRLPKNTGEILTVSGRHIATTPPAIQRNSSPVAQGSGPMTVKRLLLAAFLLAPGGAWAQAVILPPQVSGQGIMSVTTASQAVSAANITLSPNSGIYPGKRPPSGYIRIKLQGTATANVTVCWLGGTCTATTGEVLLPGESTTKGVGYMDVRSQQPTIIAASGTQSVEVEW